MLYSLQHTPTPLRVRLHNCLLRFVYNRALPNSPNDQKHMLTTAALGNAIVSLCTGFLRSLGRTCMTAVTYLLSGARSILLNVFVKGYVLGI